MRNKQLDSNGFDSQLEPDDAKAFARRRTKFLPDGSYLFEDELETNGVITATIITCAAWLLEIYELNAGELFFSRGEEQIRPNARRFGIFYPPFTITQPCFKDAKGHLTGIAAIEPLPSKFLAAPIMFETTFAQSPSGVAQVVEILNSSDNRRSIETNPKASLLSVKAKRLIDENHLARPSVARIAARLGVTHEHLSRQFKRDFGMSPSNYFRQLRVADVPLLLAKGEGIINVSHDVGYNDLSRFYKQFRQTTKTSPGVCQTMMKPRRV